MTDLPLGKPVDGPRDVDPSVLRPIDRATARERLGIVESLPFNGEDVWRCYELSWLRPGGLPRIGVLTLRVPCTSPATVESKSLKLFLAAHRNHAAFHEGCTVAIAKRLIDLLAPKWLRIGGYWYPRGGIPIDVFYATGDPPAGVWIPDQGVAPYRGRG